MHGACRYAIMDLTPTLERFFTAEDEWLRQAQITGLRTILTGTLEPESAFTDLVYVLETLTEMGLAPEEEIMLVYSTLISCTDWSGG
jgi:hypothetical protein